MNSITILGRRWFEKTNGNTYHSCTVLADGVQVGRVDFTYGYGDHYRQTGTEILQRAGLLPGIKEYPNGGSQPLWQYCSDRKIALHCNVADVQRKKDL